MISFPTNNICCMLCSSSHLVAQTWCCINQPLFQSLATKLHSSLSSHPIFLLRASGFIGIHRQGHLHTRVCYILILSMSYSIHRRYCTTSHTIPSARRFLVPRWTLNCSQMRKRLRLAVKFSLTNLWENGIRWYIQRQSSHESTL